MDVSPKTVSHMDHEQRQMRRIRDPDGGDVHEVFQAPVLFGIPEVKLDVEPSTIIVHEWRLRQVQVTAKQDDMGAGVGAQVGLGEDDDMQRLHELLMEHLHLVQAGLDVPLHGGLFEVWHWEVVVIHLVTILAPGTSPGIGAGGGEGQRHIAPQLGNEVQAALARHIQGIVVAKVPIQYQGGHREHRGDELEQGGQHGCDPYELRGEWDGSLGMVCTALRTSRTTLGVWRLGLLGSRFGLAGVLFRVAAYHLLNTHRERPPFLDTHQGHGEEGQPWHRFAVQARKETIKAMGVLASFRDDDCIASDEVDVIRAMHMLTKEDPKQDRPRDDSGKQALYGAIAPALSGPAGQAQHGDASGHDEQGKGYPTQLAEGRRRDMGSEALEKCYNVHQGLLRRLRVVAVVDDNSTTDLR